MKILTLDNERPALNNLNRAILEVKDNAELISFTKASEALNEIESNGLRPDVAFLDIEMPGMTGIELAGRLKKSSPRTWIIFVTGFSQYALEAFTVHAGGYLMKPATTQSIREEFANIGHCPDVFRTSGRRVKVQCFGNFEVFLDGVPLSFARKKSKELFAYLVHKRGTACTTREIAAVLFEDSPFDAAHQSYLQTIISNMCRTFKDVGEEEIIVKTFGSISVNTSRFDCDYYSFLSMDPSAINSYTGEYMSQYMWGEFTAGFLSQQI